MPENENDKTVDLDTSGPGARVELPEVEKEADRILCSVSVSLRLVHRALPLRDRVGTSRRHSSAAPSALPA